jgi:hypothetical protein
MSSAAAVRLRRHRQRKREGVVVLQVAVGLADHIDLLVASGLLGEWDDGDRTAIEQATARLLRALAEEAATRFEVPVSDSA